MTTFLFRRLVEHSFNKFWVMICMLGKTIKNEKKSFWEFPEDATCIYIHRFFQMMFLWLFFAEWISKGSGFNVLFTSVHLMKLQVNHPWCFPLTFFNQGRLYLTPFPPTSWISDFAWCPSDGKIGDPCLAFSSSYWVVLGPCLQMSQFSFCWTRNKTFAWHFSWVSMMA